MDTKTTGTEKTGGVFDFGPAPEAAKDAATVEGTTDQATEQTTQEEQTTKQPEGTTETTEDNLSNVNTSAEGAQEQTTETEQSFEVDGRTFTSRDELVTAYRNSSSEGIRLAKLTKEFENKLAEREAMILELEAKQVEQPFPGLLSTDKDQEEAQLSMLPQHKQTEYILAKREWEKEQATKKADFTQKQQQVEATKQHIKEIIEQNSEDMASKPQEYPMFKELGPTMQKVVALTPSIANRPETPYLSYWIAYGLSAFNKEKAQKTETQKATEAAKTTAKSAQAQIGKSGIGKQSASSTSGTTSSIAQAYRQRNGVEL